MIEPLDLDAFEGRIHGHPIPALLAEIRRLRAALAQAEQERDQEADIGRGWMDRCADAENEHRRLRAALAQAELERDTLNKWYADAGVEYLTVLDDLGQARRARGARASVVQAAQDYVTLLDADGYAAGALETLRMALIALTETEATHG